jgi:HK97 family phage prohead protease
MARRVQRTRSKLATRSLNLGPQVRGAEIVLSTIDEKERTFEVVWTTGARVLRSGWFDSLYEELSLDPAHVRMGRMQSGRSPYLDCHNSYSTEAVVGRVTGGRLDPNKAGYANVKMVVDDERADKLWNKIRQGALPNVSVGYRVYRYEQVEGGDDTTPVYRAVDWEPHEISVVPIGADADAYVRSSRSDDSPNLCLFVSRIAAQEIPMATKLRKDKPKGRRAGTGKVTQQPPAARAEGDDKEREEDDKEREEDDCPECDDLDEDDPQYEECCGDDRAEGDDDGERAAGGKRSRRESREEIKNQVLEQERKRADGIERTGRLLGLAAEAAEFVKNRTSLAEARRQLEELAEERSMNHHGKRQPSGHVEAGLDRDEKFRTAATECLILRSGKAALINEYREKFPDRLDPNEPKRVDPGGLAGLRMLDIGRICAEMSGDRSVSMKGGVALAEHLLRRGSGGGAQTTSDLPVIMENVLNKTMLARYALLEQIWRMFCVVKSLNDFRPHIFLRNGSFGELDDLTEHGEVRQKDVPDAEKETIKAATKGNIISLTREVLINDQVGALVDVADRYGETANRSLELSAMRMVKSNGGLGPKCADGKTLFHGDHGNITDGTALGVSALDLDAVKMADQTDHTGEVLDLQPSILMIARGLRGDANVINDSVFDIDPVAPGRPNANQKPNKVRGLFKTILGTARLSGTRRYLLAAPGDAEVFACGFLDGVEQPQMAMEEGFRIPGYHWRILFDFGFGVVGYRGAVTNAGVAP